MSARPQRRGDRPPRTAGARPTRLAAAQLRAWPLPDPQAARRALDTAVALGDRSGQPVSIDTRLRETHLGDWQGMTHLEVDAVAPGARTGIRAAPGDSATQIARERTWRT